MIQTVTGAIEPSDLGLTLSHEHVLIDMSKCVDKSGKGKEFYDKLSLQNRYLIHSDPYALLDNASIVSEQDAIRELKLFKSQGGTSIVDCTPCEIGRDPQTLKRISEESGVNIVMGCGHYYDITHSQKTKSATIDEFVQEMTEDLTIGVDGTGIKAGVIGEIGSSAVVSQSEWRVLRAAGIVSRALDKAIHVHTDLYTENGIEIVKTLKSEGAKEGRICIDHVDVLLRPEYVYQLLDMGVWIEFDNFGKEFYVDKDRRFAYDLERVRFLKDLINRGYSDQILICNDICLKSMLTTFGGNGYAHIINTVKTMLLQEGVSKIIYDKIMTDNVAKFLG